MFSRKYRCDVSCASLSLWSCLVIVSDWHLELTGTFDWYHVVSGALHFRLLPLSQDVLDRYQQRKYLVFDGGRC